MYRFAYLTTIIIYLSNTAFCHPYNINASHGNCVANFCTDAENYPYDEIREALEKHPEFKIYSGLVVGRPNRSRRDTAEDVGDACRIRIQKMLPQVGINIKKDVATIVNTEEFKQEVPQITCVSSDECQQKYGLVELVVYEADGSLSKNKFRVPAGCGVLQNVVR